MELTYRLIKTCRTLKQRLFPDGLPEIQWPVVILYTIMGGWLAFCVFMSLKYPNG